jgi:hypothetical protein
MITAGQHFGQSFMPKYDKTTVHTMTQRQRPPRVFIPLVAALVVSSLVVVVVSSFVVAVDVVKFSSAATKTRAADAFVVSNNLSPLFLLQMTKPSSPQDAEIVSSSRNEDENTNANPPRINNNNNEDEEVRMNRLKADFATLLRTISNSCTDSSNSSSIIKPEEIPSLLTQNIDVIMAILSTTRSTHQKEHELGEQQDDINLGGMASNILEDIIQQVALEDPTITLDDIITGSNMSEESGRRLDRISDSVDMILEFVENFGLVMKDTDDKYKLLLRQLFESIAPSSSPSSSGTSSSSSNDNNMESSSSSIQSSSPLEMEEQFDNLLAMNKEAYTPGFVRYIDGECKRLESLLPQSLQQVDTTTTTTTVTTTNTTSSSSYEETMKMIQILRVIQTRILDELGKEYLGEGAIVLGQLLGYDNDAERLAILDAGLTVRGYDYAIELQELTKTALDDFSSMMNSMTKKVKDVVDPELVRRVEIINRRIEEYIIDSTNNQDFQ